MNVIRGSLAGSDVMGANKVVLRAAVYKKCIEVLLIVRPSLS